MMIPEAILAWLSDQKLGDIFSSQAVSGGCINHGVRLKLDSGRSFFLKTNTQIPKEMFACEFVGLEAISVPGGPSVPKPYLYGSDFILMEDLSPAPPQSDYWSKFGIQLATLHNESNQKFGFYQDNYVGRTPQPNTWMGDGYAFFAEKRLIYQARLGRDHGFLSETEVRHIEKLANSLHKLIPEFQPSLIHGDLWTGNAITDSSGNPAIIDPATYFGWAEADLAMTTLFGIFPTIFYSAYQEVRYLEPGFKQRFPIYNLYHLLNHLNMFGMSYYNEIRTIVNRYP